MGSAVAQTYYLQLDYSESILQYYNVKIRNYEKYEITIFKWICTLSVPQHIYNTGIIKVTLSV